MKKHLFLIYFLSLVHVFDHYLEYDEEDVYVKFFVVFHDEAHLYPWRRLQVPFGGKLSNTMTTLEVKLKYQDFTQSKKRFLV